MVGCSILKRFARRDQDAPLSRFLAIAGAAAALLGAVLLYARAELFAPQSLADHATATLDDEDVRRAVAPSVVDAIESVSPAAAPTADEVADLLANPRVSDAFGAAAGVASRRLFGRGSGDLDLDLAEVTTIAVGVDQGISASELGVSPAALEAARLDLIGGRAVLDALEGAEQISWAGFILVPIGVLALLLSISLASGPLRGTATAAVAVAIAAGLTLALLYVGREVVVAQFGDELTRDAVASAWETVLGGLRSGLLVTVVTAAVVAMVSGAAASRREPVW